MTLNIYEGGLFFDNILQLLKEVKPDLAYFQEVHNGTDLSYPQNLRSMQGLEIAFPGYHSFFAPELLVHYPDQEHNVDIGNAIFSRYPISQLETVFLNGEYGVYPAVSPTHDYSYYPQNMQTCTVHLPHTSITACNLHGIWELSGGDTPERLSMSDTIIKTLEGRKQVIMAGDFNVKPDTQTIQSLEKHYGNVFKDTLTTTFNVVHKDLERFPGYATAVVDMVFISPGISVHKAYVPDGDVSDHLPLVCELGI